MSFDSEFYHMVKITQKRKCKTNSFCQNLSFLYGRERKTTTTQSSKMMMKMIFLMRLCVRPKNTLCRKTNISLVYKLGYGFILEKGEYLLQFIDNNMFCNH